VLRRSTDTLSAADPSGDRYAYGRTYGL